MEIDEALIRKVAKIARLNLTDQEIKRFLPEFKEILDAFEILSRADVSGKSPLFHPVDIEPRLRKDQATSCLSQSEALSLAKHRQDGYFKGPKAIK